jgi:very-short-patch-repair endonuclease
MRGGSKLDARGFLMPQDRLPPTAFARKLRREMTEAEHRLWTVLRGRRFAEFKFRRQVPIGPYIADFLCFSHRVIVEVDGSQHSESIADEMRDAWLKAEGFSVVRLWNGDVMRNHEAALDAVFAELALRHPSSGPSGYLLPQGEKEE